MHPRSLFSLAEHLERLSKGGRPPFDLVAMFKVLVLQAQHNLSDARMEFMIRDRLSWMRFFGFDLGGTIPDENTMRCGPA